MAEYNIYPAVDEGYNFPPEIRGPLASSAEFKNLFDAKAPLASPLFTGTPKAPNPDAADSSQQLATTSWVRGLGPNVATLEDMAAASSTVRQGTIITVRDHTRPGAPDHLFSQWIKQGDGAMRPVGELIYSAATPQTSSFSGLNADGVGLNNFINQGGAGYGKAWLPYMTRIRNTMGDAIAFVSGTNWNYWDAVDNRAEEGFARQGDVGYDAGVGVTSLTLRGGLLTFNFSFYTGNARSSNGYYGGFNPKWRPVDGNNVFGVGPMYDGSDFISTFVVFGGGGLAPCSPRTNGGGGWNAIRGTVSFRVC